MINLIDKTSIDENRILELADEYINYVLPDKEDINNRLAFSGCLRYIYNNLFKPSDYDICINNQNSKIPYQDIVSIQTAYNKFIDLCCKYKKEFTLSSFCLMTGIESQTLDDWLNNRTIPDYVSSDIPTRAWSLLAQKIKLNSEKALSESMLNGNLMAYAQLKVFFNWQETPQTQQITITAPMQSAANIAQKYSSATLQAPPQQNDFSSFADLRNIENNAQYR